MYKRQLKAIYRTAISSQLNADVQWIFLNGSFELIWDRMQQRAHFMPPELLKTQFQALETPENAWVFDISESPEEIVSSILKRINEK